MKLIISNCVKCLNRSKIDFLFERTFNETIYQANFFLYTIYFHH